MTHGDGAPRSRQRERLLLRRLRETLARLRMAAEMAGLGFWEWDLDNDRVYFSPEWKKQLGYERRELRDQIDEWRSRLHPHEQLQVEQQLRSFAENPTPDFEIEYRLRHRNGQYRWLAARCMRLDDHRRRIAITHIDVTNKRTAEEQLRYVAGHDGLTGLPNRRLLYEFAEHMVASARRAHTRLAVLFIDLDDFKPVNDTYGHHMGDRVLREAAQRISLSLRGGDLVGRIGGDEFVAVLAKIDSDKDVAAAAMHTLESLRRPYHLDALDLQVPASVGVSVFPRDGLCIETLIEHADAAMYHAKAKHGDKLQFFLREFQSELRDRSVLVERIKQDLPRNGFRLVYQPVFDCTSQRIVALDAQLRWPQSGLPPNEFIPLAETSGQILALGEWTVREAGRQARKLRDQGLPPMPISVKVSPLQFFRKDFCRSLTRVLAEEGAPSGALRLEVCEATLMRSDEEVSRVIEDLHAGGVGVEIKDFGHGYSCLERLSHLPIACIKINLAQSGERMARTLLLLGHRLGCEVVACHVESADVLEALKRQHYRRAQGFHLCPPLTSDELGVRIGERLH